MSIQLGRLAEVNPTTPEFDSIPGDELITFMPLEACWADGRADFSRRSEKSNVANGYTRFRKGDVILPKITPTFEAGRVFRADIDTHVGAATTEVHVLRACAGTDARFLAYVGRSQPFLQLGAASLQGVGNLRRITTDFVRTFPIAPLDLHQQIAIADYLDRETAQIDTLIAKQEQLIATLRERRHHAIDQHFTGGEIDQRALKYWLNGFRQGVSPQAEALPATTPSERGVLKSGCVNHGVFRALENKQLPVDFVIPDHARVSEGDLIVSRASGSPALVGSAAIVTEHAPQLMLSDKLFALVPRDSSRARYLYWFLNSTVYRDAVLMSISGAEGLANNLPLSALRSFRVPVPSLVLQERIALDIDEQTAKIDTLIAKAERFIELSKERRAALITAAVTGQLEIPAA